MSNERRDLHDLFRADLEHIELPPEALWIRTSAPPLSSRWSVVLALPAALGMIALALVLALVVQIVRGQTPPNVASSAQPSAVARATPIPASPLPLSTVRPVAPNDPVRIHNTLPPEGQWALVLGWSETRGDWSGSIVAVPLSGQRKDALHLISLTTFASGEGGYPWQLMRAQLSPDARRIVLSATLTEGTFRHLGLVIVDLVAGTVTTLTTDRAYNDVAPAWNPKSDEIAFVRLGSTPGRQSPSGPLYAQPEAGIWMVHADGSALRRVMGPPPELPNLVSSTALYGWNATGTALGFSQGAGLALEYKLLELATGNVTQAGTHAAYWTVTRGGGDWREGSPAFVGAMIEWPAGRPAHIDVADDQLGSGGRSIVDGPFDLNTNFQVARWRPGSNDVLYVGATFDASAAQNRTMKLFVTDASGRAPQEIKSLSPARLMAAWTPDGGDIVWVEAFGDAAAVHLVRPDGTNDRLVTSFARESKIDWIDLAVLRF